MKALLQKYFIALPYEKKFDDWLIEIYDNPNVIVDSLPQNDTVRITFLQGRLRNAKNFFNADSVKFSVYSQPQKQILKVNGNLIKETLDTVFCLWQAFYFPLEKTNEKQWKELHKNVQKEFGKYFSVGYPTSPKVSHYDTYETVWFHANSNTLSRPIVIMQYGKIKKRSVYFILLALNFTIGSAE